MGLDIFERLVKLREKDGYNSHDCFLDSYYFFIDDDKLINRVEKELKLDFRYAILISSFTRFCGPQINEYLRSINPDNYNEFWSIYASLLNCAILHLPKYKGEIVYRVDLIADEEKLFLFLLARIGYKIKFPFFTSCSRIKFNQMTNDFWWKIHLDVNTDCYCLSDLFKVIRPIEEDWEEHLIFPINSHFLINDVDFKNRIITITEDKSENLNFLPTEINRIITNSNFFWT